MGQNLVSVTSGFVAFFLFCPRKNYSKGQGFVIEREGERKYKICAFCLHY